MLKYICEMTKSLCSSPHLKPTVLDRIIQFGLNCGYYTLTMWFPMLFHQFQKFALLHPNEPVSICEVPSVFIDDDGPCDPYIDYSVTQNTLIIGLACIPTSLWLPLCVHKLGAKFFLVLCLMVPGAMTLGLYIVRSVWQNLGLSCVTSLAVSLIYCVMVDLFPKNLRAKTDNSTAAETQSYLSVLQNNEVPCLVRQVSVSICVGNRSVSERSEHLSCD